MKMKNIRKIIFLPVTILLVITMLISFTEISSVSANGLEISSGTVAQNTEMSSNAASQQYRNVAYFT